MSEQRRQDEQSKTPWGDLLQEKAGMSMPANAPNVHKLDKDDPRNEFFTTSKGEQVRDVGEQLKIRANREKNLLLDRDAFFTELYEDYLVSVQRHDLRYRPSGVVAYWDESTSFGDFLKDSESQMEKKLSDIRLAKEAKVQKFRAVDDSILAEAKIDPGSKAVGQTFGQEDYEVVEEILRRSLELIQSYNSGKLNFVINDKTGRVRMVSGDVKGA